MMGMINELSKFVNALDIVNGSADRNGAILNIAGFDGYLCIVKFGTIAAGATTTAKLQDGDQSDLSDATDITGASQAIADTDDNKFLVFDVWKPRKQFHRVVIDKDALNSVQEAAIYIPYRANKPAVTNNDVNLKAIVLVRGS